VPLRNRRHLVAIRLPDDGHHLLFREPRLSHRSLRIGSQSLYLSLVRKSGSRSVALAPGPSRSRQSAEWR
jgi:hypothetical protein